MNSTAQDNWNTFERELPRLLAASKGKFALLHGGQVAGVYDSETTAENAGYDRFGFEQFLVQEITDEKKAKYFSRNVKQCP
jgi:hypothetical protein